VAGSPSRTISWDILSSPQTRHNVRKKKDFDKDAALLVIGFAVSEQN
jgi:hypothetical protein